jgi:serine/threonine protein kinase
MAGLEGQIIGGCRIIRRLGGGGMGEVYLAEQMSLQRQVAIKLVRPELEVTLSGASVSERFAREARAIAAMEHPHILPVYDYGEKDSLAYLVMAYAPHGSLQEALTPGNANFRFALPVSLELAGTILDQAAQALQHAHDRGVLHRDIKPANFLLRAPDASGGIHLLLADFGLAKFAAGGQSSALYAGTVAYSAPEQIQRQATPASDQYGLAVMAYLLLAGRLPFTGDAAQILYQQIQVPAPSLREKNPAIPAEVDAVILRALAKRPEERWPSVAAFAMAYREALGGQKKPSAQVAAPSSLGMPGQGSAPVGVQSAAPLAAPPAFPPLVQYAAPAPVNAETVPTLHPPVFSPTTPIVSGPPGALPFPSVAQQRTVQGGPFGGESVVPGISPPPPYVLPPSGGGRQRRWIGIVGGAVGVVALILAVVLVVNLLGGHGKTGGTTTTGTPGTGSTPGTGGTPGVVGTFPGGTSGAHISNVQTGLELDDANIGNCRDAIAQGKQTQTFSASQSIAIAVVFTAKIDGNSPAPAAVVSVFDSQKQFIEGADAQDLSCPGGQGNYSSFVDISGQGNGKKLTPGQYFIGISYIPDYAVYLDNQNQQLPPPEAGVPVEITS